MDILGIVNISNWVLLLIIGLVTFYIYATWNYGYFEKQGLKTDSPVLLFGNVLSRYLNKHIHIEDQKAYKRLGNIHGMYEGRQLSLMAGDPELIKQILVKNFSNFANRRNFAVDGDTKIIEKFISMMEGEEWKTTRHLLSPTFTSGKLKQMGHLMEECAIAGIQNTKDRIKAINSNVLDIKIEYSLYTMNVISSCAFGLQAKCKSTEESLYVHSKAIFGTDFSWKFAIIMLAPWLARLLKIEIFPVKSINFLKNICKEVMDRRKQDGTRRPDFLQLLLDAQVEEEKGVTTNGKSNTNGNQKIVLDEMCLIAQAMLFLVAGFEAVATTASVFTYMLALNPQCYETLMKEIDETKKQNQGRLTPESIVQMPYLEMVMSECLRLHPLATRVERVCTNDITIGDIHFKKGLIAYVPIYALHHDETYYPDPEKFEPERFSSENKDLINPYAYLPFGAGPRNCLGMRFAQMQAKIGLAHYLDNFKFSRAPETEYMEVLGLISIPDWMLLTVAFLTAAYVYLTWNYGFYEKQGVIMDKPWPIFGNTISRYIGKCIHDTDLESYRKFGKFHGFYEGRTPALLIGDPEKIKLLLVKNFNSFTDRRFIKMDEKNNIVEKILLVMQGEEWRLTRHYLTPAFTTGKLKQMGLMMEDCGKETVKNLTRQLQEGAKILDVKGEWGVYTMNVIATCAFGISVNDQSAVDPFLQHMKAMFGQHFSIKFFIFLLSPKLANFFGIEIFPSESREFFVNTARQVMELRRKEGIRRPDFLQLLLDAQDEEAKANSSKISDALKNVLDDECIIAQVISFLMAGFDNVSSAISFALYLLALNPECQTKIQQEIDNTKEKHGEHLPFDVIVQMKYLDMVLSETLRLYPSLGRLERVCTSDCLLGDIHVKKGMVTLIPVYAMHRDPEYFSEPEKFDPERFNEENRSSINPYAYLPFGAGPRNCMGMRFAQMSTKVGLVYALDKFTYSKSSETEIPIKMVPGFPGLQAINGIQLKVEIRK